MSEAQPVAEGGITSQQRAARDAIANNTADTTEFGADTTLFRQIIRDQPDDLDIELSGLSLTKLPNLGADLGYIHSVILDGLSELRETTQTHMRDLLVAAPDELLTTLNVGDIKYLMVEQEQAPTMMQVNFVGPITKRLELGGIDVPDTELSLTAPAIILMDMSIETLKIGPGCLSIALAGLKNLKTIEFAEPGALASVRFHNLPSIEHYTDLPDTAHQTGNVFHDEDGHVRNLLPAFSELPELPLTEIPETTIPFANQQVYDFEENEEVPMITLLSKMGNIIFKAKESYFTLPLQQIETSRKDGSQIRYKCNGELHGAPLEGQVDMGNPYYYIQGNGNFIVPLHELTSALTKYKIIELEQTDSVLDYIASAKVVMLSPTNPVNQYGEDVNIVSADHCQDGTKQRVFKLSGVVLTQAETGGQKKTKAQTSKRHVSPKRTVSKKRSTYKKKRNYQGPYINPTYNLTPFKR